MFTGLWSSLIGIFGGLFGLVSKVLEHLKEKQLINHGIEIERAAQLKREAEIARKQTEVILEEETKEETSKRLKDGTF